MAATVLVVEDDRTPREPARSSLGQDGFTVLSAGSGTEALTLAAASAHPVLLQLGLPDVPGKRRSDGPVVGWRRRSA